LTSIGDSLNLSLSVLDSNGNAASCTPTWTSNSPEVATVNNLGRIMAKGAGLALISASCGGAADTARAEVLQQQVHSVAVSEKSFSLALGASKDLFAVAHDARGYAIREIRISWQSTDPSIASVDSTGRVAALAGGRTNIIASAAGKADTAAVEVAGGANSPPPASAGGFVVYSNSNIEFILGPQLRTGSSANPWPFFDTNQVQRGVFHANDYQTATSGLTERDYYDLGLTLYNLAHRTGDAAQLQAARKHGQSRWQGLPATVAWEPYRNPYALAPRGVSLGGLILYAMDGGGAEPLVFERGPENAREYLPMTLWQWIEGYTRKEYQTWLGARINNTSLHFGVRDGGYMLLYTAWLAEVHPDAKVRQDFRQMALTAARDYYVRLQREDGGWYWHDGSEEWSQPFMVGLLLEGMVATHQLTGDKTVGDAIVRSVDWLWNRAYDRDRTVPERPDLRWRQMPYFVYPDGRKSGETNLASGWDLNTVREGRQRNTLVVHAFGYAYHITGNTKYRDWGDEIFAATFGRTNGALYDKPLIGQGPGADGLHGLADFRGKEYNQAYRSAGRYLAWRLKP
jgi:hypothetical protein